MLTNSLLSRFDRAHPPTMNWLLINKVLPRRELGDGIQRVGDDQRLESFFLGYFFFFKKSFAWKGA